MKHTQITVITNTVSSELVAYFMQEHCYDGVSIVDANDLSVANWDYMDDSVPASYTEDVLVRGYCSIEDTDSVLIFLRAQLDGLEGAGSCAISTCLVEDTDWIANWQKNFAPIDFGSIVVCPEWLQCDSNGRPVLLLDNGAAFGTGQHETTSMCIQLLADVQLDNASILDVGCGSGILALCALLLGGKQATLVDVDDMCTDTATANAKLNKLDDRCNIICGNLCDKVDDKYDIVLANLTADILYMLAEDIATTLHDGSHIILSGILTDRVDKVIQCYTNIGCRLITHLQDGEWSALHMEYIS